MVDTEEGWKETLQRGYCRHQNQLFIAVSMASLEWISRGERNRGQECRAKEEQQQGNGNSEQRTENRDRSYTKTCMYVQNRTEAISLRLDRN